MNGGARKCYYEVRNKLLSVVALSGIKLQSCYRIIALAGQARARQSGEALDYSSSARPVLGCIGLFVVWEF